MMRIGAVNYLNSKPLVVELPELAPNARVTYDLPSRLADSLAAGRLDVALVPSVEYFRAPGYRIVSDACVACRGPVLSVKLHFRVPPPDVRRVALDEGSRTSAALTQILLAELCGVRPAKEPLPIGCGPETTDADAVLLIGDRAISRGKCRAASGERSPQSAIRNPPADCLDIDSGITTASSPSPLTASDSPSPLPTSDFPSPLTAFNFPSPLTTSNSPSPLGGGPGRGNVNTEVVREPFLNNTLGFVDVWDLGQKWCEWTGLPFVFAMWIARGADNGLAEMAAVLNSARDRGVQNLDRIAAREAPLVGISHELAQSYLRDNLHFELGRQERAGLRRFYELCVKHDLAPRGLESTFDGFIAVEECRK